MKIVPPDTPFTTEEAAEYLGISQRQVQRLLVSKKLDGRRPNGNWLTNAIALWRYMGIDDEMKDLWIRSIRSDSEDV